MLKKIVLKNTLDMGRNREIPKSLIKSNLSIFSVGLTYNSDVLYVNIRNHFPLQSLKIFTFCVKLSDSIFFLLSLSPIVN